MVDDTYPKTEFTNTGWLVKVSKKVNLPGKYTNQAAANKALQSYMTKVEATKQNKRAAKKDS